jgi:hypothetical protein
MIGPVSDSPPAPIGCRSDAAKLSMGSGIEVLAKATLQLLAWEGSSWHAPWLRPRHGISWWLSRPISPDVGLPRERAAKINAKMAPDAVSEQADLSKRLSRKVRRNWLYGGKCLTAVIVPVSGNTKDHFLLVPPMAYLP